MATIKKNIKKAQGGDSLAIKRAEVYKAYKPILDSAQKKNLSILDEEMKPKQKAVQAKPKKAFKNGGVTKAKDGKWIQKATASIKRRGTEGKCTPITKPGCTGKAKTLAKTFKKMAKARKK
jgi:hypothetical protein